MRLVGILFSPLKRILDAIPEEDFYILSLAVDPDCRGAGIGSLLMNDIDKRASASGSFRLSLDVSAKKLLVIVNFS